MTRSFDLALNSLECLPSDRLYRFAVNLLRKATRANGHLTATRGFVCALYNGEWNTVRVALRELKDAGIIYLQNAGDLCLITFCAWLPLDESMIEKRSPSVIQNRSTGATPTTSDETEPVIGSGSRSDNGIGIGIGMVGRYDQDLNPNQDQDLPIPTYLPTNTAVSPARANGYHANGNAATLEAETDTPLQQTAPPPVADGSPSPADDAERIVAILTDEEIGLTPANAERVARLHTFPFVVKQIASWWDDGKLGPGALFKNRLMNARQFPPGRFSEEFRASELYARHYPLKGPDLHLWRQWLEHREHIEHVTGLEDLAAWANALPATLRRTLEQLPVPTGGAYE